MARPSAHSRPLMPPQTTTLARDANQQIFVVLGLFLGTDHGISAHNGKLALHALLLKEHIHQADQNVPSHIAGHGSGREFPVQNDAVCDPGLVDLCHRVGNGGGAGVVMASTLGVDRAKAVAERLSCVTSVGRGRGAVAVLNICRDGVYARHIFAAAGIGAVI